MEVTGLALAVTESSQVGEARRRVARLATSLGFNEEARARLALVVTEAATNLLHHGDSGWLLASPIDGDGGAGLEILALDKGRGMASAAQALRDGYSTGGTPGTGLGAMSRAADVFDIHSGLGLGTAILMQVWASRSPRRALEVSGVAVPPLGDDVCGDAWAVEHVAGRSLIIVADGLGHGPDAAEAAGQAVQAFRARGNDASPRQIMERVHAALRSTRGAAVLVVEVDLGRKHVRCSGIGNISASVRAGETSRHLVSHNGIVGHEVRRIDEFSYPWPAGGLLVIHSDGVTTHWDLARYAGLGGRRPGVIAGVLYRDFNRGRDDATVVVAREAAA